MKKWIVISLKVVLAAALIFWLVQKGLLDIHFLVETVTFDVVFFCALIVLSQLVINNFRWLLLLSSRGFNLSVKESLRLTFIGQFFNFAVPGGVGGDLIKGYYVMRSHPGRRTEVGLTVLLDRVFGVVAMLIFAVGVIFLNWQYIWQNSQLVFFLWSTLGLLLLIILFFAISLSGRSCRLLQNWLFKIENRQELPQIFRVLISKVNKILTAIHFYRQKPTILLRVLVLSLVSQFTLVVFAFYLGECLGESFSFTVYLFVMPLAILATSLPLAPAGVGVGQAAFYFLMKNYTGVESSVGPNIMTLFQILSLVWGLLGAYFYIRMKGEKT